MGKQCLRDSLAASVLRDSEKFDHAEAVPDWVPLGGVDDRAECADHLGVAIWERTNRECAKLGNKRGALFEPAPIRTCSQISAKPTPARSAASSRQS